MISSLNKVDDNNVTICVTTIQRRLCHADACGPPPDIYRLESLVRFEFSSTLHKCHDCMYSFLVAESGTSE